MSFPPRSHIRPKLHHRQVVGVCGTLFLVRFLRDEHGMLNFASKCLDLRRFTALTGHQFDFHEENYEDIKKPLEISLELMMRGGGRMSRTSMRSSRKQCFWLGT
jgi:hypothetical protein